MTLAQSLPRFFRSAPVGIFRRKVAVNANAANAMLTTEPRTIEALMPIGLVGGGKRVKVVAFRNNGRGLEKRLEAMGIRVGSELNVLQQEAGSTVVRVGGTRVALGVAMMHRIMVVALD